MLGQVWGEGRGVGGGPGHHPELGGSWGLPLPLCRAQLRACGGGSPTHAGRAGQGAPTLAPRLQHSRAPTPHCAHRRAGTPSPRRLWPYGTVLSLGRVAELCSWAGAHSLTLRGVEGEHLAAALGVRDEDWGSELTVAGAPSQPLAGAGGSRLPGALLAGSQLQLPHVSHHRRGVEGLLPTPECLSLGTGCLLDPPATPLALPQHLLHPLDTPSPPQHPCTPQHPCIFPPPHAHLPLALRKVFFDLLTHRLVDVLVQGCVPSNPEVGRGSLGAPHPMAAVG